MHTLPHAHVCTQECGHACAQGHAHAQARTQTYTDDCMHTHRHCAQAHAHNIITFLAFMQITSTNN